MDRIIVKGAREHNLKNIDLELPRNKLVVVSGVSGSGKSTLVLDTIYQESRRRFLETLPTYVLQLMERMHRPEVDLLDGLSPAVAVEQRNPVKTSRSTVGTITELYDYLRLLYARAGVTVCPGCGSTVRLDTPESVTGRILDILGGKRATVAFTPLLSERITPDTLRESLLSMGFIRVIKNAAEQGETLRLDEEGWAAGLENLHHTGKPLYVIVDRLRVETAHRSRLAESVSTAFAHGEGKLTVFSEGPPAEVFHFSERYHCEPCERTFPHPSVNLFSFNNSYGACPVCRGFGSLLDYDPALIVPDTGLSLEMGALDPWSKPRYAGRRERLESFCLRQGIDIRAPWSKLAQHARECLIHGAPGFEGVIPFLKKLERKRYKQYIRFFLRSYQSEHRCPECSGTRLRKEALDVLIDGVSIAELVSMSITRLESWFARLPEALEPGAGEACMELVGEIRSRLDFLLEVGLGYLSLSRLTRTLSGGEYQRIMLTRLLGSGLTDTLFVLDEPTVGLHYRDTSRLIGIMKRLVERGNSLLVVEHDREVIRSSEHLVELGPGSGEEGGRVVFSGPFTGFAAADTLTSRS
ncbi:MAG: hypothetical protein U9N45_03010, partial [Gemmatimonadota bacterium]|nr:hypothetical protein [Gemmatimonadota bacterium]